MFRRGWNLRVFKRYRAPWSSSEIAELGLLARQFGRKEIADRLGRTEVAIETKLYRLNGPPSSPSAMKRRQRRRNGALFFLS